GLLAVWAVAQSPHRDAGSADSPSFRRLTFNPAADFHLLNQDGANVRFFGDVLTTRVVAINFIFTTCTTICPPLGANFAKLQKLLGKRMGQEVRLVSISVDPVTDTPERLKAWSRNFGAGRDWMLLTGEKPEIERLR